MAVKCELCGDGGMIREEYENGWTVNRCDCKTPEYWQERIKQSSLERKRKIREFELLKG